MTIRHLLLSILLLSLSGTAFAQREPIAPAAASTAELAGLRDVWSNRNLTPFKGQMLILAGPNSSQSLSIRGGWSSIQGPSEFGLSIRRYHAGAKVTGPSGGTISQFTRKSVQASMPIGVAFAPINNLEVGIALPFMFGLADDHPANGFRANPNVVFGDLPLWATYQITDGKVQVGVRASLFLPTQSRVQFQAGLPVLARLGGVRIESGVFVHMTFHPEQTLSEVFIPARVGFQINPEIFAGFRTGLNLGFIDGETFLTMPLYGFAGYTLNTNVGPIDLGLQFGFDQLFRTTPWIQDRPNVDIGGFKTRYPGDGNVDASDFSLSVGANIALQF